MPLRRVHLGSLLVIALALAGASVAPSRQGARGATSITWQADDARQAPTVANSEHRQSAVTSARPLVAPAIRPTVAQAASRHSLFQRPPPYSSDTRSC